MSEKEKKILERLSKIIPELPDTKKERLLGVAEGMNIMKEAQETASGNNREKSIQEAR